MKYDCICLVSVTINRNSCHFFVHRWIHDYQDACIDKLNKFITGQTPIEPSRPLNFENGGSSDDLKDLSHGKKLVRVCSVASLRKEKDKSDTSAKVPGEKKVTQ